MKKDVARVLNSPVDRPVSAIKPRIDAEASVFLESNADKSLLSP